MSTALEFEGELKANLKKLVAELNGKPTEKQASADLEKANALAEAKRSSEEAEQLAEDECSSCKKALDAVAARERVARDEFVAIRDELAGLKPPKVTKSLGDDWTVLVEWVEATTARLTAKQVEARSSQLKLAARRSELLQEVSELVSDLVDDVSAPVEELRDHLATIEAAAKANVESIKKERERVATARAEVEVLRSDSAVAELLGKLLKNDRFQRWLLEEAMADLVERATVRLRELTVGQYSLVAEDGSFRIVDHTNADEVRDARSLSGGETFLTSLALALALAESSMDLATEGTARLEAIFLDEGFGSLDPEALEVVAGAIEELATTGRMVGIVTHIRDLAERMPTRFEVSKTGNVSSVQRVDA